VGGGGFPFMSHNKIKKNIMKYLVIKFYVPPSPRISHVLVLQY
jgi:hypothetical protein